MKKWKFQELERSKQWNYKPTMKPMVLWDTLRKQSLNPEMLDYLKDEIEYRDKLRPFDDEVNL